jgi:chromosome segregation ATPase
MIEIILSAAVGFAGGMVAKDKIAPNTQEKKQIELLQQKLNIALQQNEKSKQTINELREEYDKCSTELKNVRNKVRDKEDVSDDMQDAIDDLKKNNRRLISENEDLKRQLDELQILNEAKRQELETLKNK